MNRLAMCVAAIAALIAAPAFAADMPVQAPPPAPKPVYSWTGWYVGGNVGYSWGDAKTDLNGEGVAASPNGIPAPPFLFPFPIQFTGGSDTVRLKGAIGGPQVGYNYQVNSLWVLGLESDFQISGERGSSSFVDPFSSAVCSAGEFGGGVSSCAVADTLNGTATTTYTSKIEWFGTVRGRVGLLFGDQILVYGTGGLAYGRVQISGVSAISGTSPLCPLVICAAPFAFNGSAFSATKTNVGFSAGAGMEGKLGFLPSNWTWKLEYLYVDLGSLDAVSSFNGTIPAPFGPGIASGTTTLHTRFTDNIVRVGLNYQFH